MKIIIGAALAVAAFNWFKWRITAQALIYYNEKNQYKHPTREDMNECTGFVLKHMFKIKSDH